MKNLFYSIFSVGDSDFSKNLDELERQLQKEQSSEANSGTFYYFSTCFAQIAQILKQKRFIQSLED